MTFRQTQMAAETLERWYVVEPYQPMVSDQGWAIDVKLRISQQPIYTTMDYEEFHRWVMALRPGWG